MNAPVFENMNSIGAREKIISKAWRDAEFKRLLVEKPQETLLREFGFVLPEGVNIKVVEETPSDTYFVIPPQPGDRVNEEISATDLEAVAPMALSKTNVMSGCKCCSSPCRPLPPRPRPK
jgi:hypothetical protein